MHAILVIVCARVWESMQDNGLVYSFGGRSLHLQAIDAAYRDKAEAPISELPLLEIPK